MGRVVLRRLAASLFLLWAVATITWGAVFLLGDPVVNIVGPRASTRDRENVRRYYELDRPAVVQYGHYMARLARGDAGMSYRYHLPVSRMIAARFPRTLLLALLAILIEVTLGVTFGVIAAARRGTWTDTTVMGGAFVVMSAPTFVTGRLFLMLFGYYLGWFPMGGYGSGMLDHLRHALLPAFTIALLSMAFYARLSRNELVEILQSDYVRTARAKGLPERTIVVKHALRNALLPIVTSLGLSFGGLFSGAIVTEAIYAWPGMGRLAYEAITTLDRPVIVGTVIFGAFGILAGNLLSDLAYALLDPRIRRG